MPNEVRANKYLQKVVATKSHKNERAIRRFWVKVDTLMLSYKSYADDNTPYVTA